MKAWRQGDVVFTLDELPDNATEEKGRTVLAEGEVTGHAHRITPKHISRAKLFVTPQGFLFIRVKEETHITHEEHGDIILPMGDYKVDIQREYDDLLDEVRRVAD